MQYGIPNAIVSDNKRQFNNEKFRNFCLKLGIATYFTSPTHLQSNGQVEAVNKIVKDILKKKIRGKERSLGKQVTQCSLGLPNYLEYLYRGNVVLSCVRDWCYTTSRDRDAFL